MSRYFTDLAQFVRALFRRFLCRKVLGQTRVARCEKDWTLCGSYHGFVESSFFFGLGVVVRNVGHGSFGLLDYSFKAPLKNPSIINVAKLVGSGKIVFDYHRQAAHEEFSFFPESRPHATIIIRAVIIPEGQYFRAHFLFLFVGDGEAQVFALGEIVKLLYKERAFDFRIDDCAFEFFRHLADKTLIL